MSSILERGVYHAHCLDFLERIPDSSVQVVYLDPPSAAQVAPELSRDAYKALIDKTIRQIHRILRPDGSVYFQTTRRNAILVRPALVKHFGEDLFLDEQALLNIAGDFEYVISFARSSATRLRPIYKPVTDTELRFFEKDRQGKLYRYDLLTHGMDRPNLRFEFKGHTPSGSWKYSLEKLRDLDEQGLIEARPNGVPRLKRYLTGDHKLEVTSDWSDVPDEITPRSDEYVDFVSQRPEELLRRIIMTASDLGDLVLDPFCGSGTSFVVAHKTQRKWIGCDVDRNAYHKAITRLEKEFSLIPQRDYQTGDTDVLNTKFPVVSSSAYRRYFISYSRSDARKFVDPFCAELAAAGIDFWIDRLNIPNGAEWRAELDRALNECAGMILFRTPDALDSEYVDYEWRAFDDLKKPIHQISCQRTHAPRELNRFQYTEFDERHEFIRQLRATGLGMRG